MLLGMCVAFPRALTGLRWDAPVQNDLDDGRVVFRVHLVGVAADLGERAVGQDLLVPDVDGGIFYSMKLKIATLVRNIALVYDILVQYAPTKPVMSSKYG